jgi:histidine ammonia-lyase
MASPLPVREPGDLGPAAIERIAEGATPSLDPALLDRLAASRRATVQALQEAGAVSGAVYGVSTGLGAQAHLPVDVPAQEGFQDDLMLARSVGSAPWLGRREVRATLATRLRTLLEPEAGASPALASVLVDVLRADLHPAVPATGNGAAGEIIPLAHLGGFLTGRGQGLDRSGHPRRADDLLREAGLAPYSFGTKEGVAFLQGVPVATAQAVLLGADARLLAQQSLAVAAAEIATVRAPREPYDATLARADADLHRVLEVLRALAGEDAGGRMLQAPVSFRVVGPAIAALVRSLTSLEGAVGRTLAGVSTSPGPF